MESSESKESKESMESMESMESKESKESRESGESSEHSDRARPPLPSHVRRWRAWDAGLGHELVRQLVRESEANKVMKFGMEKLIKNYNEEKELAFDANMFRAGKHAVDRLIMLYGE